MQVAELQVAERARGKIGSSAVIAAGALELIYEQSFKWVLDCRNIMEPDPVAWDFSSLQEESTRQEEKSCGGDYYCITCDVARDQSADEHHISICCDERCIQDQPEPDHTAIQAEQISGDQGKCQALDGEKREVDDEGGYDVRRSSVCIVCCFSHEDEPLIDESWDGIVGREKDEADGEDVEVEKPAYCLQAFASQVSEER